jgi:inner membrane protein involved in colicin E2 resistance
LRLSTIHQIVIGGAAVGAALVCLYSALLAGQGHGTSWGLLSAASGGCAVLLGLYLRRFRRTHRAPGPGSAP